MDQSQRDKEIFDIYSSLNDDELDIILGDLSEEEVDKTIASVERHKASQNKPWPKIKKAAGTALDYAGDAISAIGTGADYLAGAPMRAFVDELVDPKIEDPIHGIVGPFSAMLEQYTKKPSEAPDMIDVAAKVGFSTDPSKTKITPQVPQWLESTFPGEEITPEVNAAQEVELPSPATAAGVAADLLMPAPPLMTAAKGIKSGVGSLVDATKVAAKSGAKAVDFLTGTNLNSELFRQSRKAMSDIGESFKTTMLDYLDPRRVNQKAWYDASEKSLIDNLFGKEIPDALKYTPDSQIVRQGKVLAEMPGGQRIIKDHNQAINTIVNAIEEVPKKIGTNVFDNAQDAGAYLINKYNQAWDDILKNSTMTRQTVISQFPKDQMIEIPKKGRKAIEEVASLLRNEIKSRSKLGMNNPVAKEASETRRVLNSVIEQTKKGSDIQDLNEIIRGVGELAFGEKSFLLDPIDKNRLRKMYDTLSDVFTETVRLGLGDEIAEEIVGNNVIISEMMKRTEKIDSKLNIKSKTKLAPEDAFKELIEKGDSEEIASFAGIVGRDVMDDLKASWFNSKIKKYIRPEIGADFTADGVIQQTYKASWRSFLNDLEKSTAFRNLFVGPEYDYVLQHLRLGEKMGLPYMSTSKTGTSLNIRKWKESALSKAEYNRSLRVMDGDSTPITFKGSNIPIIDQIMGKIAPIERSMEPKYEGYRESRTNVVSDEEIPLFDKEIQSSNLPASEKARQMNLLRKHKRVVIGP